MSFLRKNIGKIILERRTQIDADTIEFKSQILAASVSAGHRTLVGQKCSEKASSKASVARTQNNDPVGRWRRYVEDWKRSDYPNPNRMLTINLNRNKLDGHLAAGGSISSYKVRIFDSLRRIFRDNGFSWLAAWVIEVKNHPHLHVFLYIPVGSQLEARVCRWACKHFGINVPKWSDAVSLITADENGLAAQLTTVDERKFYAATGRYGLEGLSDYLEKRIEENSKRTRGRRIGRLCGRTNDLGEVMR